MGSRRQDVDLELVLRHPRCAREWIDTYKWDALGRPNYLVWGLDRKIFLDSMDDDEAVMAAFIILKDWEIPSAREEVQLLPNFVLPLDCREWPYLSSFVH